MQYEKHVFRGIENSERFDRLKLGVVIGFLNLPCRQHIDPACFLSCRKLVSIVPLQHHMPNVWRQYRRYCFLMLYDSFDGLGFFLILRLKFGWASRIPQQKLK